MNKKIDIYKKQRKKLNINNPKKVSVIIPNYNYEKFIIERIDSILMQTYPIYEIIILDDCSTDDSVNVINKKIEQINKEYNAMVYYNDLFEKVEGLRSNNDEGLEDLCEIYSVDINSDYLFENLDTFFEAYINQNSRLNSVYTAKRICCDLEKLIDTKNI